jgi:membrane-associated phospholipid phosphatase
MASSATDISLQTREPAVVDQPSAGVSITSEIGEWVRRPDVLATPVMLLIVLATCRYWNVRLNWDPQPFLATQLCILVLTAIPTCLVYFAVRWLRGDSLRINGSRADLFGFTMDMALLTTMTWVYAHLKASVLLHQPVDEMLADWDRWLCGGYEPWNVIRQLLPAWSAPYMHLTYMAFYPVLLGSLLGLTFTGQRKRATRLCCALVLAYYVGTLGYHLLPSYGPAYTIGLATTETLSPATHRTQQLLLHHVDEVQTNAAAATIQPWLYIAAFPSLHVSHVLILAWYLRRQRIASVLAIVFAIATALSTVYLGWHYVCDWAGALVVAALAIAITRVGCKEAKSTGQGASTAEGHSLRRPTSF